MASRVFVNIGLSSGLVPDGIKPLSEPVLIDNQTGFLAAPGCNIMVVQEITLISVLDMISKFIHLKLISPECRIYSSVVQHWFR